MKTVKKVQMATVQARESLRASLLQAASLITHAQVAASKQRSLKAAQKAKIVTKSGQLTAHYK